MRFLEYVQHKHPQCTTLKSAKKYVNEWLQTRVDDGLSAWTISMETCALCKFYKIDPDSKNRFQPPERKRADIKRSRGEVSRDRHFSETNNAELIAFCRSTGLRRSELQALKGADLMEKAQIEDQIHELEAIPEEQRSPEQAKQLNILLDTRLFNEHYYLYVRNGKGGSIDKSSLCVLTAIGLPAYMIQNFRGALFLQRWPFGIRNFPWDNPPY